MEAPKWMYESIFFFFRGILMIFRINLLSDGLTGQVSLWILAVEAPLPLGLHFRFGREDIEVSCFVYALELW